MKKALVWSGIMVAVVAIGVVAWGLTGSWIDGSVVRARDGAPLKGATVEIDGKPVAVAAGRFAKKVALGTHTVQVTALGYESASKEVHVAIFRPASLSAFRLRNADLSVRAVENYPGFALAKNVTVAVGGSSGTPSGGAVTLEDLPVGTTTVTVGAAGCMQATQTVNLRPGENSVACTLTPTLPSVVKRAAQNVIDRDLVLTYQLLHPARQKQWGTQAQYVAIVEKRDQENEGMVNILSFKVLTPTRLSTYHDKPSKRTFKNVYRVPITYTVSSPLLAMLGQKTMSMKISDYWVLYNGQWRDVGTGEPVNK